MAALMGIGAPEVCTSGMMTDAFAINSFQLPVLNPLKSPFSKGGL
jgi:hypothetical protein